MFEYCADPKLLEALSWWSCYLTTTKHFLFYKSFLTVILLLLITAPLVLAFGFAGALARQSGAPPVRMIGTGYSYMVRGIPEIVFFLFIPIALDQALEFLRHKTLCPNWPDAIRQGNDFVVCTQAKFPLGTSGEWLHSGYGFSLAVISFAIVFGAFAANVIYAALNTVPKSQLETGFAFGMTPKQVFRRIQLPQMWIYALPGLSNLWILLVKATPLLFLLGIEDIVYWARELGGSKTARFDYPHGDWRLWYFLVLFVFYIIVTWASERFFNRWQKRLDVNIPTRWRQT